MAARGWGGTGGGSGACSDGSRRRTRELGRNSRLGSVLSVGCTGRTRALQGSHLGARVGKTGAGEGRKVAASGRGALARKRACGKAGKRAKRGLAMHLTAT
jgi:hypothetical protein